MQIGPCKKVIKLVDSSKVEHLQLQLIARAQEKWKSLALGPSLSFNSNANFVRHFLFTTKMPNSISISRGVRRGTQWRGTEQGKQTSGSRKQTAYRTLACLLLVGWSVSARFADAAKLGTTFLNPNQIMVQM